MFRETANDSKRAKLSDICLTDERKGRHSALTDAQKVGQRWCQQYNQTETPTEICNSEPTTMIYLIYV